MPSLSARIASAVAKIPFAAKRQLRQNSPESWAPYYAGYSAEFAETVIRAAQLPAGATIYDPWNGSGTTTLVASMLGHRSNGIDLNPAAVLIAKARLVDGRDARGVQGLIRRLAQSKTGLTPKASLAGDPLRDWLPPLAVASFRHLQHRVLAHLASPTRGHLLDPSASEFPPLAAFVLLSLVGAASSLTNIRATSNPARHTPGHKPAVRRGRLEALWPSFAERMSVEFPVIVGRCGSATVQLGDARTALLLAESADFVLTSPPYLTRLDYAEATGFSLAALGTGRSSPAYDALRRNLMGAPLVRQQTDLSEGDRLPSGVRTLLNQIRTHPTKASGSYYYKTYRQYFDDAQASLASLRQNMKSGASAILVVQSSYYKDIRVDLPNLYVELAKAEMFRSSIAFESPVKRVISTIHPGSRAYRSDLDYRESVVLLEKK